MQRRGEKLPLITGAYSAQSYIASAQRCANLYVEKNPPGSPFPTTHYLTPGLTLLTAYADEGYGWRCLYAATNGNLYGVYGPNVVQITVSDVGAWTVTQLQTLSTHDGLASINDNGVTALVTDGTTSGFWINLANSAVTPVSSAGFYGSSRVDLVDGYFILNKPDSSEFYISLYQQNDFDPLDFASKNGYSDPLVGAVASRRNVWLIGTQTAEVWANDGASDFTFGRIDGIFIQHGCAAVGSIAQMDGTVYFLSLDPQGHAMILSIQGFNAVKVSTYALDYALQQYETISDAVAYTYQINGHSFYVISFPSADATWFYDSSSGQWSEWTSIDTNGVEHRHRCAVGAFWNGMHIGGDYANGNLYLIDPSNPTENGNPIVRRRGFPHLIDSGNRVIYQQLIADFQVGAVQSTYADGDADVFLRYSDTKGKTWSNPVRSTIGPLGDFERSVLFQRMGVARDRVFELFWSAPEITALNGAFVVRKPANN